MIVLNYGPHAAYYRAGNVVECRCCAHAVDAGTGQIWCDEHLVAKGRGERCVRFRRAPGADDDAAPFFPFEYGND